MELTIKANNCPTRGPHMTATSLCGQYRFHRYTLVELHSSDDLYIQLSEQCSAGCTASSRIFSRKTAATNGSRPDVFAPDTGADAIRNEKGHIVAVRGLVQ